MTPFALTAPSYALLQASVQCWKCGEVTPVTTVWVPTYIDFAGIEEPEDELEAVGAATLHGIQDLMIKLLRMCARRHGAACLAEQRWV
ncbi:TPA: hypothetical protein UL927_000205 [Stenotrophomonas maltophilia]|uniref:hypothetical protein n=1 Tax=Stenotrophomonas maltophilia TaxID=40324 RepID=UPI001310EEAD|nr:hypothetical protein [Stenotrophomonas maltophilia]MCI1156849.1 hypothetical protein [Stenotrophomonas maltophilia]HEL2981855.1 hypothetical protein [Stenotrophomonas maltophilia]HEL3169116.1 hypothetical protein [Stenotrophomonas maltophilia]HEL7666872.1 hypothetical protein [Stenotrophomonas maltophilia]